MGVSLRLIRISIVLVVGINFAFILLESKSNDVFTLKEGPGMAGSKPREYEYSVASNVALDGLGSYSAVSKAY